MVLWRLTVCENSGRGHLDRVNHTDVVQHCNSVAMDLSVVNKRSNVNTLGRIANAGTNRNCDLFIVTLI